MAELVSGAHSARDGVFNTLDAVGRRTRAANAALTERVRGLPLTREAARPRSHADPAPERDTRFDPEEQWEVPGREAPTGTPRTAGETRPPRDQDTDEDEEYPQTWLR